MFFIEILDHGQKSNQIGLLTIIETRQIWKRRFEPWSYAVAIFGWDV